jgi:hypothetical protein
MTAAEFKASFCKPKAKPAPKKHPKPALTMAQMVDAWIDSGVERIESKTRVYVFFLPLALCQRQDAKLKVYGYLAAKMKREVTGCLRMQCRPRTECLSGRPTVRCIRFSSVEPDAFADWAKLPVDCLCAPNKKSPNRLNIIKDDAPKYAEILQIWRKTKPGKGFCVLEVYSDPALRNAGEGRGCPDAGP